ncbi:MAG: hypothetical protein JWR72_107 [Flavisolibacter sp.]|nr:hypothetical protein [Flavisolibacter sp.]
MTVLNAKTKCMKKYLLVSVLLLLMVTAFSQPKAKQKNKPPTQSEMNKMMEDAMKGMSGEEKAEMRKMMKGVMPALQENNNTIADYPEFTSNKQLVPKKDPGRVAALSTKKLLQSDIAAYTSSLFNKIITKGDASEIALVKKIIAQNPKANAIGGAAVLCMLQGHPQAAMALSMKAVLADPSNANWQNNMASLLTQYGYPEHAIPVLQKLKAQFPRNSTVLNNLGHAWLGLGETDSAETNIKRAGGLNPNHPEAKQTEGVIEEIDGNTDKATDDYIKAMENSPNPFTEMLINNSSGQSKLSKIDFEKLKRSITIYEYFPKDWMPEVPLLSCHVDGYVNDYATIKGYEKMTNRLTEKLELMTNELSREVENLADKGEAEFVKTMHKETMKGLSFMSKPAVSVLSLLMNYKINWLLEFAEEVKDLEKLAAGYELEYKNATKDLRGEHKVTCPKYDAAANKYMQAVNPLIKKFYSEKAEEFRQWVNAYITWSWYVAGNPKNIVLIQSLGFVGSLETMYTSAMGQLAINGSCNVQRETAPKDITEPEIPNFTCPVVVRIPVGADWQQLSNAAKNFDNNSTGTRQNTNNPVPHSSIAFGADHNSIAQAGRDPFAKSANGSISPGMINDELTPLSKIPLDDLTPLPKIPLDDLTPLPKISPDDLTPLPDLRKSKLAKELLKKMMKADCKNVKDSKDILKEALERMMKGVKELEAYENLIEQIKSLESEIEQKENDAAKKEQLKKQIEKMQQETDKMDKYEEVQGSRKEMEKIMKEMDAMDDKKFMKEKFDKIMQSVDDMEAAPAILKGIQQNGLQPSISSGLQAPGTFTPVKGLFN